MFAGTFCSTSLFDFTTGCFEKYTPYFVLWENPCFGQPKFTARFLLYHSSGLAILLSGGKVERDAF
jgi:hypothetical protein